MVLIVVSGGVRAEPMGSSDCIVEILVQEPQGIVLHLTICNNLRKSLLFSGLGLNTTLGSSLFIQKYKNVRL